MICRYTVGNSFFFFFLSYFFLILPYSVHVGGKDASAILFWARSTRSVYGAFFFSIAKTKTVSEKKKSQIKERDQKVIGVRQEEAIIDAC